MAAQPPAHIPPLPTETWTFILSFLSMKECARVAGVNKEWREIVVYLRANLLKLETSKCFGFTTDAFHILEWLGKKVLFGRSTKADAMGKAIKFHNLPVMQWLHENDAQMIGASTMEVAASFGFIEGVEWMRMQNIAWTARLCVRAVENGHFDFFVWAVESGCPVNDTDITHTIICRHEAMDLQWALKHGCQLDSDAWELALLRDSVALAICLLEFGFKPSPDEWSMAASFDCKGVFKWAVAHDMDWQHEKVCDTLVSNGNLRLLKWVVANNCPLSERTCTIATQGFKLDVLTWAVEYGCVFSESSLELLIRGSDAPTRATLESRLAVMSIVFAICGHTFKGSVRVWYIAFLRENEDIFVSFLHKNKYPWTPDFWENAVQHNRMSRLQWAEDNGIEWRDARVFAMATSHKTTRFLSWLHAHGCPWDTHVINNLIKNAWDVSKNVISTHMLTSISWAIDQKCPCDEQTCALLAKRGLLDLLKRVRAQGAPWDASTCDLAAGAGHRNVIEWARAEGCPWSQNAFRNAAVSLDVDMIEWLQEMQCPCPDGMFGGMLGGILDFLTSVKASSAL